MNTIEPLYFDINGEGISTDENYRELLSRGDWDETSDFVVQQACSNLCDEISPHTLRQQYAELVETELEPIRAIMPELGNRFDSIRSPGRTRSLYYVRGDTVVVPSYSFEGLLYLISNNKNSARDLRSSLTSELENKAGQFHGAGIEEIIIHSDEEFTTNMLHTPNLNIAIQKGEPGPFEEEILDEIKPISEAFTSNLTVDFVGYSPCPEYDILWASSPNSIIQLEVKDYSGTDNEPSEDDVIHRPLRKADLLNIEFSISVVKGVSEDKLAELRKSSALRNRITIFEKNELVDELAPLLEDSIRRNVEGPAWRYRLPRVNP